jgi:hypothetical protein
LVFDKVATDDLFESFPGSSAPLLANCKEDFIFLGAEVKFELINKIGCSISILLGLEGEFVLLQILGTV